MRLKVISVSLLAILLTFGMTNPVAEGINAKAANTTTNNLSQGPSSLGLDQSLVGDDDILNSIVPYILKLKNQTGSWNISMHSDDNSIYTGIAGGLAGLGLEMIKLSNLDDNDLSLDQRTLADAVATEIGYHLMDISTNNVNGSFWPIALGDEMIDLGYDFGLSGIAHFFAMLYNQTEITDFKNQARETFQAIDSLSNYTQGLHWNSSMVEYLANHPWYPIEELTLYRTYSLPISPYNFNHTYFNGRGLGSLGVADAALKSIQLLDIQDTSSTEYKLLNSSIYWLEGQLNETNGVTSIPVADPDISVYSTSKSFGASGAISFFLDMYTFSQNSTYLGWSQGLMDWLNGTDTDGSRAIYSMFVDDSGNSDRVELGVSHGVAGNLQTMMKFINMTGSSGYNTTLRDLMFNLHQIGVEDGNYYKYPAYLSTGSKVNLGTINYGIGGGGIMTTINDLASFFNTSVLDTDLSKAKSYVYSNMVDTDGFAVINDIQTDTPELNPSIGVPSSYHLTSVDVLGNFELLNSSLDFAQVEVGNSLTKSVSLTNLGDTPVSVSWTDFTDAEFKTSTKSINIDGRTIFTLSIAFTPTTEGDFDAIIAMSSSDGDTTELELTGQGYNNPTLSAVTVLENNSIIENRDNIDFQVDATDSSGIDRVTFTVNNQSQSMTTVTGSSVYNSTWDLTDIQNGTYIITFTAFDTLGHNSSLRFVYTVGVYDTPLDERIFSDAALIALITVAVIILGAAIFVTRKYMG